MIPNQWYPVLEARALGRRPAAVRRMGRDFVLFRGEDGRARCLLDRCPHRGAALSRGAVRGDALECPYHGLRFDGEGRCTRVPCEAPDAPIPARLAAFAPPVREAHGLLWMWWGAPAGALGRGELPPVPWFPGLEDAGAASSMAREWPVDHQRAAEGMLDFHHAKFVHGRAVPTMPARVGVVEVRDADDGFTLHGTLVPEPGTLEREQRIWIEFRAPSLQMVRDGGMPRLRFIIADCPIDETRTWRYLRQYYRPDRAAPGAARAWAWVLLQVGWHVIHRGQDLPVVRTQPPPRDGDDHLLRPDMGIARYRRLRRQKLREAAATAEHMPPPVRAAFEAALAEERLAPARGGALTASGEP
jgi:nitrite reductase/ring-hydroxylating ferredoxin subunit